MDPNELLQQLMQLLQPNEANAAVRSQSSIQGPTANPMIDFMAKLQAQQAGQLQNQQAIAALRAALQSKAAETKAASPQAQAQLAATQAKAQPKPDLASLLGMGGGNAGEVEAPTFPGDTFGGGPGAPITFGTNPRTGEQAFNNFGWVNTPTNGSGRAFDVAQQYASPESQAAVEAARAKNTGGQVLDKAALAALYDKFKAAGQPIPEEVKKAFGEALTGGAKPTPEQAGKMFKFDPNNMTFIPLQGDQSSEPTRDLMKQGYQIRTQPQLDSAKPLVQMLNSFNLLNKDYQDLSKQGYWERVSGKAPFGAGGYLNPTAGSYLKNQQNFTTFFDSEVMGKRGASSPQMQMLRARVLPALETNPELGGKLMKDWAGLLDIYKNNEIATYSGRQPDYKAENDAAAAMIEKFDTLTGQPSTQALSGTGWQTTPGGIRYRIK